MLSYLVCLFIGEGYCYFFDFDVSVEFFFIFEYDGEFLVDFSYIVYLNCVINVCVEIVFGEGMI